MDFAVTLLVRGCVGLLTFTLLRTLVSWLERREVRKSMLDEERERLLWYKGQAEGGMLAPSDYPDVLEVTDWR